MRNAKESERNKNLAISGLRYIAGERRKGKQLDQEVFFAVCNTMLMCSIELMCVNDLGEILLFRRPESDKFYSNQWHSPGTIFMPKEKISDCIKRVRDVELRNYRKIGKPVFMGVQEISQGKDKEGKDPRQQVLSLLFVQSVKSNKQKSRDGEKFFALESIPKDTIGTHKKHLIPFLKTFLNSNKIDIKYTK